MRWIKCRLHSLPPFFCYLETVTMKKKEVSAASVSCQTINLWRIKPHLKCGFCISFYFFDKDTLDLIQFPVHVCCLSSPWVVMAVATKQWFMITKALNLVPNIMKSPKLSVFLWPRNFLDFVFNFFFSSCQLGNYYSFSSLKYFQCKLWASYFKVNALNLV